ncbi:hypothetical protein F511_00201 [Dorcoceras hygrometricum]|nr:hypothetical protein F511_00201 [Dorcoceras hygrometricum]
MVVPGRMLHGNISAKTHFLPLCSAKSINNSADFDKTVEEEGSSGKDKDPGATSPNQYFPLFWLLLKNVIFMPLCKIFNVILFF